LPALYEKNKQELGKKISLEDSSWFLLKHVKEEERLTQFAPVPDACYHLHIGLCF